MRWKLRIPLILLIMGLTSSLFQIFSIYGSYFTGLFYIVLTGGVILLFERTGGNNQKVHVSIGMLLIFIGIVFDYASR